MTTASYTLFNLANSLESVKARLSKGMITYATAITELHAAHGSLPTKTVQKVLNFQQPNMASSPEVLRGLSGVNFKSKFDKSLGKLIDTLETAIDDLRVYHKGFCLTKGETMLLKIEVKGESALSISRIVSGDQEYNTKYFNINTDKSWEAVLRSIVDSYRNVDIRELF